MHERDGNHRYTRTGCSQCALLQGNVSQHGDGCQATRPLSRHIHTGSRGAAREGGGPDQRERFHNGDVDADRQAAFVMHALYPGGTNISWQPAAFVIVVYPHAHVLGGPRSPPVRARDRPTSARVPHPLSWLREVTQPQPTTPCREKLTAVRKQDKIHTCLVEGRAQSPRPAPLH